eukprot:g11486.t1
MRQAQSRDIGSDSVIGGERLRILEEEEEEEEADEEEKEEMGPQGGIHPCPRAGAAGSQSGRPCLCGPGGCLHHGAGSVDVNGGSIVGGSGLPAGSGGRHVGDGGGSHGSGGDGSPVGGGGGSHAAGSGGSGGYHGGDRGGHGGSGGGSHAAGSGGRHGGGSGGSHGGGGGARQDSPSEMDERDWRSIKKLLFYDNVEHQIQDTANWNELFQEALELPENNDEECYTKWQRLTTVNRDFVAAAVTYGKTIISEYFLPTRDKSIRPVEYGGACGGIKFVWRGILFKLADGSKGPYCGNDEAAAKGAGHDLRGATHYLGTRIRELHYALQCLIDYKGFRMTAQAELPVNPATLKYGTADGGKNVHHDDDLARKLKEAAKKLNLRTHFVKGKEMHSACDIEGHRSDKDHRYYLLDFSRSFPPESPYKVDHLSKILSDGTPVHVNDHNGGGHAPREGVISAASFDNRVNELQKRHITYTVRFDSTKTEEDVPATRVADRHLSIYWRMLRPEFVKGDADTTAYRQCAEAPDSPAPPNAPALGGDTRFSRISEAGESDYSSAKPGTAATEASFRGLAQAAPQAAEGGDEEEKVDRFGEDHGYEAALSAEGLDEGSGSGDGNTGGGDADPGGEASAACSTPTRRGMGLVHQWVGSYEVFMDYDPMSQTERGVAGSFRGSSSQRQSTSSKPMRRSGSSILFSSLRGRGANGNNSAPVTRPGSCEVQDNSGRNSLGRVSSVSFFGGGSDGAVGRGSRRAAPRAVVLEGVRGSSSNVSYRFYDSNRRQQPSSLPNVVQDDIAATDEWQFIPLSPDALSGFTKDARDRSARNQEVHDATSVMVDVAVLKVAERLMGLPPDVQGTLDLAVELHRHGVNVRHLGKVRSLVHDDEENSVLRDMMLTEIIARTLKNILRCFQRKWMKAERSTSEQGMRMLVVEFLNLVTGCHRNSETFWKTKVLVGVLQRFGVIALTRRERRDILNNCIYSRPHVLEICVARLTEMQGLVLTPEAEKGFSCEGESPFGFEFVVSDIQEIRPIVRYMHILDYGGGVMLSMQADKLRREGNANPRTVERLKCMARQCFITAYQSLPDDENTRSHLLSYSDARGSHYIDDLFEPPPQPQLPISLPLSRPRRRGCLHRALASVGRCCSSTRKCMWSPGCVWFTENAPCPKPREERGPRRSVSHGYSSAGGVSDSGGSTGLSHNSTGEASEESDGSIQWPSNPPGHMDLIAPGHA